MKQRSAKQPMVRQHQAVVPEALSGMRLDRAVAQMFPDFSRSRIKHWIEQGLVLISGAQRRPRDSVFAGEQVALDIPVDLHRDTHQDLIAQAMPLTVMYQDTHLLVIDKPTGLVVHPGAGNPDGTLVNGLLHYDASLSLLPRAGLIHRLDKDTSGVLVVARTLQAHHALIKAMQARHIKRTYMAVCAGRLSGGGTIDQPIARHSGDRTRMAVKATGKPAVTHYRLLKRFRGNSLIEVELETGRTHQIRVHFAYMGHPLVGDRVYGRPSLPRGASAQLRSFIQSYPYQALHALQLEFTHPITQRVLTVRSHLPANLKKLIERLQIDVQEYLKQDSTGH